MYWVWFDSTERLELLLRSEVELSEVAEPLDQVRTGVRRGIVED